MSPEDLSSLDKEAAAEMSDLDAGAEQAAPQPPWRNLAEEQAKAQGLLLALHQQNNMIFERLMNINAMLLGQAERLGQHEQAVAGELRKFQTGGAQRAMAAVYHKLFRDLISHLNNLDSLATLAEGGQAGEGDAQWLRSIAALRDGLVDLLAQWGLEPIPIVAGAQQFDPEVHESVEAMGGEMPADAPANVIWKVVRRGWRLNGVILQFPQVVAS